MICELIVKCVTLIAVIHGLRIVGRRIGPRASGMILGMPSSTAILLILCGRERGWDVALDMADASLLGLVAAVSLPVVYAHGIRRGCGLPAALVGAIAAYVVVASGLGMLHFSDFRQRLVLSCASILVASWMAWRIQVPAAPGASPIASGRWTALSRTIIPIAYLAFAGVVSSLASPRWAGLVGTFPSISTVVLAVTHMEEGRAAASRIARALPPANLSTAAFLAAFWLGCPRLGPGWGMVCAYGAALLSLLAMQLLGGWLRSHLPPGAIGRPRRRLEAAWIGASQVLRYRYHTYCRPASPHLDGVRPRHRRHFFPVVEMLPC